MKKIISILIVCVMLLSCTAHALPSEYIISVYVDGEKIEFDVNPISENGRTLVPMRYIFEALGAEVNWIQEENKAVAAKGSISIEITLDSNIMLRNGTEITLDVAAKAMDGRILVPARAVSEALDAKVEWNQEEYKVIITSAEEPYIPGEYHYTELSERDMDALRKLYPDLYNMYAAEILYENMAEYPADVAELINAEDARIRMFADDVWNNLMAHTIINIQTESQDMYIFDIPEDAEIDSYTLMNDYIAITEKENMSSEAAIETSFKKVNGEKSILEIRFEGQKSAYGVSDAEYVFVTPASNGFRYFLAVSATTGNVTENKVYEITKEGKTLIEEMNSEGMWSSGAKSHIEIIDNIMSK